MSDYKYSPIDLYWKIDNEGGLFEAAFGYGIQSEAIADDAVDLKMAWQDMERAYREHFHPAYERVLDLLEEISEAADDDPETA